MKTLKTFNSFSMNESFTQKSASCEKVNRFLDEQGFDEEDYGCTDTELNIAMKIKYGTTTYIHVIKTMEEELGWYIYSTGADYEETYTGEDINHLRGDGMKTNVEGWGKDGFGPDEDLGTITFKPQFGTEVVNLPKIVYVPIDEEAVEGISKGGVKVASSGNEGENHKILGFTNLSFSDKVQDEKKFEDVEDIILLGIDTSVLNIKFYKSDWINSGFQIMDNIPPTVIKTYERI